MFVRLKRQRVNGRDSSRSSNEKHPLPVDLPNTVTGRDAGTHVAVGAERSVADRVGAVALNAGAGVGGGADGVGRAAAVALGHVAGAVDAGPAVVAGAGLVANAVGVERTARASLRVASALGAPERVALADVDTDARGGAGAGRVAERSQAVAAAPPGRTVAGLKGNTLLVGPARLGAGI